MLKQRIITAVILAPLALAGVFLLPVREFAIFLAGVLLLGAYEWAPLSNMKSSLARSVYCALVFVSLGTLAVTQEAKVHQIVLSVSVALWLVAGFWILRYPKPGAWSLIVVRLLIGVIFFCATWISLVGLKSVEQGNAWLLLLFLIVWGADTGAYFSGKRWGKTKLAPNVSPGKTREGLYGGLVTVAVVSCVFALWNELSVGATVYLVILSVITGIVSVMGDLFESLLKRFAGLKDSGTLLPGHGGVLDRIDSLLAAAPFFYLGLILLPVT